MFETYTNLAKLLGKGILVTGLTISNWFGVIPEDYFIPEVKEVETIVVHEYLPAPAQSPTLGSTFLTPDVKALFETSLATGISSSATSMTLVSGTDKDGNTLASSTYAFIIDEGTSVEEFVLADCTSTVCTNISRGISVSTGTTTVSALKFAHRRGASVKMTDATSLIFATNVFKGKQNIENPIRYNSIATSTLAANRDNLASAGLVADTAFAGAGVIDATTAAKGNVEIATQLETASSTSLGGSGATVVIPASNATSTYNSQTAALRVIVTQNNGQIDSNFVPTTTLATLSGNNTFTGNNSFASTTFRNPSAVVDSLGNSFIWRLIATSSNPTAVTSHTFDITASSTLLKVVLFIPNNGAGELKAIQFNGDTGNTYTYSASSTGAAANTSQIVVAPSTATWSLVNIDIIGGVGLTRYITTNSGSSLGGSIGSASWVSSSTEPIRTVTIKGNGGNIDAGTKLYVYGSSF